MGVLGGLVLGAAEPGALRAAWRILGGLRATRSERWADGRRGRMDLRWGSLVGGRRRGGSQGAQDNTWPRRIVIGPAIARSTSTSWAVVIAVAYCHCGVRRGASHTTHLQLTQRRQQRT